MENCGIEVTGLDAFTVVRRPVPVVQQGESLVRVTVTGLCRTDLKLLRAGHRDLVLPRIPGEEAVGVVETSCGEGPLPGTRVWVYPGQWCGQCPTCRAGAENLCRSMRIMGFHRDGGFARYVVVPSKTLVPLPADLPDTEAIFAEPLSCCLNALELARLRPNEQVCVWGAGTAGTLVARAARALAARVGVIDPDPVRCERAGGLPRPDGSLCDVAVVAVGDPTAYQEAMNCLGPRGRLVVFSGLAPVQALQPADFNRLHYYEQTLVGAYGCAPRHGPQAINLIAAGAVPVADLVTHYLPLWDLSTGLDIVAQRTGLKVLLDPWSPLP